VEAHQRFLESVVSRGNGLGDVHRRVPSTDEVTNAAQVEVPSSPAALADAAHYLHELYLPSASRSSVLSAYYALKPLIPRRVQLAMRRRYVRRQLRRTFPAWPTESVLLDLHSRALGDLLTASGLERLALVGYWPRGFRFAAVLTHDVEGPLGLANIARVLEVERRHGVRSSWNFVAEDYDIPEGTFDLIRAAGGEIGLHGIRHDGKLFRSRATFEADLPKIRRYLADWGAVGFRSPATHRNSGWMSELPCLYDSSFPDTDPFEPQPGGCCSILPFCFGEVVELPITLLMDHTMFEILRWPGVQAWTEKSEWLIRQQGLINLITHPDYLANDEYLARYDAFVGWLVQQRGGWMALPREVAEWWKLRGGLCCETDATGDPHIVGTGSEMASIMWASRDGDRIAFELAEDAWLTEMPAVEVPEQRRYANQALA
jgi:peptidoglycan/xylan/chitin deacetylase (PgdA/CDA1 family)